MGLAIGGRMYYLQIVKNGYYSALALGQNVSYSESAPLRGEIFFQDKFSALMDSSRSGGQIAATNKDWFLLYAVPREIEDATAVASALASLLYREDLPSDLSAKGLTSAEALAKEGEIYSIIKNRDDPFEPIMSKLDEDMAEAIGRLGLVGIYTKKEKQRYYPADDLASHVLGFVGYRADERVGQYGAEGFYDDEYLKHGKSLDLSIDYNIQFVLEEKLKEAKDRLGAEGASGIVIDPKTGEIMALAVIEEFDLNNYSKVESIDIFLNDITQKIFEPGSVFKPFTLAAALDSGIISPSTKYEDAGKVKIGRYTIHNSRD